MHEAVQDTHSSGSGQPRRGSKRRAVICLVSANPLAIPELCRLARGRRFRLKTGHLRLGFGDVHDPRLPHASVYVLDAFSTGSMTEAVVAGVRARRPRARVIVLLDRLPEAQGIALLQLGVKGILRQKEFGADLPRAIAFVAAGGVWMPRGLMAKFLDSTIGRGQAKTLTATRRLSQRERQVLDRIVKNQSNKEIASELHISASTVKFHVARLFTKFGVRRRADLILQSVHDTGVLVH